MFTENKSHVYVNEKDGIEIVQRKRTSQQLITLYSGSQGLNQGETVL